MLKRLKYMLLGFALTVGVGVVAQVDQDITDLSALTDHAAGDFVVVVDVSDPTMSANGTNKKQTIANFLNDIATDVGVSRGSTNNATYFAEIQSGGTGDPRLQFLLPGPAVNYAVGVDNSDSDKFTISRNSDLGTNPILQFTSGGVISLFGSNPAADRISFWDNGAVGMGWLVPNNGLTITGTDLDVDILGIEALADPGADRLMIFDDGTPNEVEFATAGVGIAISATDVLLDFSELATATETDIDLDADLIVIQDGTAESVITPHDLGMPITAMKAVDESVTTSTTFQNDDELTIALDINSRYTFYLYMIVDGGTVEDFKFQITCPTSATGSFQYLAIGVTNDENCAESSGGLAMGGAGVDRGIIAQGSIITAGSTGNVTIQWAQNFSGAVATVVNEGSYMTVTKTGQTVP